MISIFLVFCSGCTPSYIPNSINTSFFAEFGFGYFNKLNRKHDYQIFGDYRKGNIFIHPKRYFEEEYESNYRKYFFQQDICWCNDKFEFGYLYPMVSYSSIY